VEYTAAQQIAKAYYDAKDELKRLEARCAALEGLSDYVARHGFDEVVRHQTNGRIVGSKKSRYLMKLMEAAARHPLFKVEFVTGALTDREGSPMSEFPKPSPALESCLPRPEQSARPNDSDAGQIRFTAHHAAGVF
jgi:hypothetical protein